MAPDDDIRSLLDYPRTAAPLDASVIVQRADAHRRRRQLLVAAPVLAASVGLTGAVAYWRDPDPQSSVATQESPEGAFSVREAAEDEPVVLGPGLSVTLTGGWLCTTRPSDAQEPSGPSTRSCTPAVRTRAFRSPLFQDYVQDDATSSLRVVLAYAPVARVTITVAGSAPVPMDLVRFPSVPDLVVATARTPGRGTNERGGVIFAEDVSAYDEDGTLMIRVSGDKVVTTIPSAPYDPEGTSPIAPFPTTTPLP